MKEPDELWQLIREGDPLPEPPAWFVARTVARLRNERTERPGWLQIRRWLWAGGAALFLFSLLSTWQVHIQRLHDQQVTFAALDLLASGDKPHLQEETWFTSD